MHCWFSGRILACHAGDRGSIPRQCKLVLEPKKIKYGSRYLSDESSTPGIVADYYTHDTFHALFYVMGDFMRGKVDFGTLTYLNHLLSENKNFALSGNRTPVSRVAGENSTTEPTMLAYSKNKLLGCSDLHLLKKS